MTALEEFATATPPLPRDRHGRPLIVPPEGGTPVPYSRASSVPNNLEDGTALKTWWGRNVGLGVARSEDLAAVIAGLEYGDQKLDDLIEEAHSRAGGAARANYGTAIHRFTEAGAHTEFIPARMAPDVDAYNAALSDAGIEVLATEQFTVNDELKIAGTYDHLYRVPGFGVVVGDKKTGKYHPNSHAVQMAPYSHGFHYSHHPEPRRWPLWVNEAGEEFFDGQEFNEEVGLVVHIPAGKGIAELHFLDLTVGMEGARLAMNVKEWRTRKDVEIATPTVAVPYREAPHVPAVTFQWDNAKRAGLEHLIATAPDEQSLLSIWTAHSSMWDDDLTSLAAARKSLLLGGLA